MKIKELEGVMHMAWSPANQNRVMIATGTAAQQLGMRRKIWQKTIVLIDNLSMSRKASLLCPGIFFLKLKLYSP